ncbi:MAG: ABC transporter ATP-binding protein [Anaerolineales bacterium]|jgi:ABC-2 type transport system ATP-binding protein
MDLRVAILAQSLTKRFRARRGETLAVDHISLEVNPGETFGLIGPDGAGKSTTTRVILGLLRRDEGQSSILGFDSMREVYEIRERVGYVAQQFALPGDLTVIENLRFFADLHGLSSPQQKKRIPELLRFAGLTEFAARPAARLSGGMKKKLALARSLIHEPEVVLLDEPTLGVDPVSRREFWNLLANLRSERGMTIFVCTPYMDEAERCDRIGLIYKGCLIANDTPARIKALVPGSLVEFKPSQLAAARNLAAGLEGVLEVQTYGAMLHLFLDDVDRRRPEIESALARQGISSSPMRVIEVRMEEAFISLIRRQEASQGG